MSHYVQHPITENREPGTLGTSSFTVHRSLFTEATAGSVT